LRHRFGAARPAHKHRINITLQRLLESTAKVSPAPSLTRHARHWRRNDRCVTALCHTPPSVVTRYTSELPPRTRASSGATGGARARQGCRRSRCARGRRHSPPASPPASPMYVAPPSPGASHKCRTLNAETAAKILVSLDIMLRDNQGLKVPAKGDRSGPECCATFPPSGSAIRSVGRRRAARPACATFTSSESAFSSNTSARRTAPCTQRQIIYLYDLLPIRLSRRARRVRWRLHRPSLTFFSRISCEITSILLLEFR
jgi:hypothetical protein